MNRELIEKYYRKNCSEQELIAVLAWFEKSAETTDGKSLLYKTWEETFGGMKRSGNWSFAVSTIPKLDARRNDSNALKSLCFIPPVGFRALFFGLFIFFKTCNCSIYNIINLILIIVVFSIH